MIPGGWSIPPLDGIDSGYKTGKALFEAMGGKGGVVAIQGRLANSIAIARYKGFEKALKEYPEVKLLDARPANWSRQEAMQTTESWLVANPDLKGVWAANDEMALGAIEALRAMDKAGQVPATGIDATGDAVAAVIAGEMACTISPDPYWQAGMSLSFAYHAYTGQLNPAELPREKRVLLLQVPDHYPEETPKNSWRNMSTAPRNTITTSFGATSGWDRCVTPNNFDNP